MDVLYTDLTEVPGKYTNVVPVPVPKPGDFCKGKPVPRVLCHGRTELKQVPGTGIRTSYVQNLHKFRVRVTPGYGSVRTLQNTTFSLNRSLYGTLTELCTYSTDHNLFT